MPDIILGYLLVYNPHLPFFSSFFPPRGTQYLANHSVVFRWLSISFLSPLIQPGDLFFFFGT